MASAAPQTPPTEAEIALIDEQRAFIHDLQKQLGTWAEVAKRTNIPQGTISTFASGKYNGGPHAGGNLRIAEKLARFRSTQIEQATLEIDAPVIPEWFETETSRKIEHMLRWAQRGKITVAAMGPGTGKTRTARQFKAMFANVFMTTMSPSTAGVNNMQIEVLEALGEKNPVGTPQKLSRRIKEIVADLGNPVIIIDEAQHLSEKAIEEIRSWHDATRVGIALLGNIGVMQRLEGGSRSSAFAQLYSRLNLKLIQPLPTPGDIDALAAAWGIHDDNQVAFLRKIGLLPGGLRGVTHTLELAMMISVSYQETLDLSHIQDAWHQLSARPVMA